MELGKFIAKVISDVKENVKDNDSIGGERGDIELDLMIHSDTNNDKIIVGDWDSHQHVNRLKIPLHIMKHD